ncbi:ABC transporter ATP-binding protein [Comamonas aquatilis]|uniref:ABC transporter ATP-binding protein n=1 Tax=Comamonas aquatilis TaxID=1778406 RepID=UPI0039F0542F
MLDVRNIAVRYGKHEALHGVNLQVQPGELVVMLGANGAGKSSLLKALGGMIRPEAGASAQLAGKELMQLPAHAIVQSGLALVPEGRGVFGDLSVKENLLLGAQPQRARTNETQNLERVFTLFPKLRDRLPQAVRTMSGGEQQMVAVGRALMSQPDILLLDEPSLGLSPLMCKELFAALARIKILGMGVLLVEQNARQSLAIADRGYLLETGRIVGQGSAKELSNSPAVRRAYLGGEH